MIAGRRELGWPTALRSRRAFRKRGRSRRCLLIGYRPRAVEEGMEQCWAITRIARSRKEKVILSPDRRMYSRQTRHHRPEDAAVS